MFRSTVMETWLPSGPVVNVPQKSSPRMAMPSRSPIKASRLCQKLIQAAFWALDGQVTKARAEIGAQDGAVLGPELEDEVVQEIVRGQAEARVPGVHVVDVIVPGRDDVQGQAGRGIPDEGRLAGVRAGRDRLRMELGAGVIERLPQLN